MMFTFGDGWYDKNFKQNGVSLLLTPFVIKSVVQFAPEFAVVYSCFGIFIVFLSKCNVNFTSPLEDDFSGEGQLSGSSIFHDKT